jgi:Uma2 family endonuclease
MAELTSPRMSASEYLEAEHIAEFKSEYMYGQVFAMSGASPSHASIVASATAALGPLVKRRGSTYYSSDLKVGIEGSVYCYPDLTVVCGKPEFVSPGKDVLANPTVIVEVLSPSTALCAHQSVEPYGGPHLSSRRGLGYRDDQRRRKSGVGVSRHNSFPRRDIRPSNVF